MSELANAFVQLDEQTVYKLVDQKISEGVSPLDIIKECNQGLTEVGELFALGQYYLTELMFSAEIMQAVMEKLEPLISNTENKQNTLGTVVIGTVKGDIHDIGKSIVVSLLKTHGFEVIDLGVDVPAEKFIEAVKQSGAKVLGMSALLNSTYQEMKNVVDALEEAGLRENVKVIIGGTICTENVRKFTGADAYANDAMTGVKFAKSVYGVE
ncbi:corrinoid protein [Thermovorax subterraneus]|nr:corrinoid protein [Thermovorax subterraneus]